MGTGECNKIPPPGRRTTVMRVPRWRPIIFCGAATVQRSRAHGARSGAGVVDVGLVVLEGLVVIARRVPPARRRNCATVLHAGREALREITSRRRIRRLRIRAYPRVRCRVVDRRPRLLRLPKALER